MGSQEFTSLSKVEEVLEAIDLTGKRVLITGGVSGLGEALVKSFAVKGAELLLPVRNMEVASKVVQNIKKEVTHAKIELFELDLSDFNSIRSCVDTLLQSNKQLDIQINNAGIMACPLTRNAQGYEMQICTNHLGHFLLTGLLLPLLKKSGRARVVSVSSLGHRLSPVVFDDIHFQSRPYEKWQAYAQSKTANVLFAVEMNRRFSPEIEAFAVHPGGVWTRLQRDMSESDYRALGWIDEKGVRRSDFKTPEQGAATAAWAATAPELLGKGGIYLENCALSKPATLENRFAGYAEHAVNLDAAKRLWAVSEEMVDFRFLE